MNEDALEGIGFPDDAEEDKYEDAGELEMSSSQDRLYLTRLPKMLWEALSKLHENEEIRIGTLRVQGDQSNPSKVSLRLDHDGDATKFVPREFNLRTSGKSNANTFVFSEKNLPGYTRKYQSGRGSRISVRSQATERSGDHRSRGKGFRGSGYRKAIPKRTALVGHVQSEFTCLPVENEQYGRIMEQRARYIPKPKHELQVLPNDANMGVIMNGGNLGSNTAFENFIRNTPQQQKKQQQKATRMPKNELRDFLFDCFRSFKFWYMRDLKVKTQQPEPWLRDCLEDIAELVRTGPHANTWRLKPSSTLDPSVLDGGSGIKDFDAAEEAVAPGLVAYDGNSDVPGDVDDEDDDDGENIKMEDVQILT